MIYWLLFILITSVSEALLFHNNKFKTKYKHYILTAIRGAVCLPLTYLNNEPLLFLFFSTLIFPFLHDGTYYTTRHLLNKKMYPKMWFSNPYKSTAWLSLSLFWRLLLFIFGLGLLPVIL